MALTKQGDRKFYDLPEGPKKDSNGADPKVLSDYINGSIIGRNVAFEGPYGQRRVVYCDYIASGKSLRFIEDFITSEVLSNYGNTHTTTSVTSLQTTLFRHESRDVIRNSVNASEYDNVIFTGSGCTGAVHKLVNALKPTLDRSSVVVFASLFEHHSNLLPWRESGADIVLIEELPDGTLDLGHLERELQRHAKLVRKMIGTFCAASNITGQLNDDLTITALLHNYGALSFWDYATAAPYVVIDMNPKPSGDDAGLCRKDAIFFSMHKFIGGVQTPGVLVVKKEILRQNAVPVGGGGGGAVFFVKEDGHRFLKEAELREEAGTPAIVESIRAGLVMQLKNSVGERFILGRERELMEKARSRLAKLDNLILLGNGLACQADGEVDHHRHLPVLSFVIRVPSLGGRYLHHNYVCALLNDLFGVQARGGCACSGPYAQRLLGMTKELSDSYEKLLLEDERLDRVHLRRGHAEYSQFEILRPGFCRINLPWFSSDAEIDFILDAVEFVANFGWRLMPQYIFNNETAEWKHHTDLVFKDRKWLGNISYKNGRFEFGQTKPDVFDPEDLPKYFSETLAEAEKILAGAAKAAQKIPVPDQTRLFTEPHLAELRWIVLPSEAKELLLDPGKVSASKLPPFTPKVYSVPEDKTVRAIGSYSGDNLAVGSNIFESKRTFVLKTWFENAAADEKATAVRPEKFASDLQKVENGLGKSKVGLTEVENGGEKSAEVGLMCSVDENGIMSCILPKGQRPDPPKPLLVRSRWRSPSKDIFKPFLEAVEKFDMVKNGDRVLVCLSGGKDSLTLLHTMRQYQFVAAKSGIHFELAALTVDPCSAAYDPRPLIPYLAELGLKYLYETQNIMEQAKASNASSICAFCSRMKRGRMYAASRRDGFNVLAFGQHLDDLAESFVMSIFHNGRLRTMKANYTVAEGDLRVIRPFAFVREKQLRDFAVANHLPVIAENCPACFESPKERHRTKQVLAQQELLFPKLYWSLKTAMLPMMAVSKTGLENFLFGKELGHAQSEPTSVE